MVSQDGNTSCCKREMYGATTEFILAQKYQRKLLIQPKCMRLSYHLANFNESFSKKKKRENLSKSFQNIILPQEMHGVTR